MDWIRLKVTDPKKFKKLDTQWRKDNKDYLRKYNTEWRRISRFVRQEHERIWNLLIAKVCKHRKPTQKTIGILHDRAWHIFDRIHNTAARARKG